MNLFSKGLLIFAVLAASIYYDIPSLLTFIPKEPGHQLKAAQAKLDQVNLLVSPLKGLHLALAEVDKNRIQLLTDEDFRWPENNPVLESVLGGKYQFQLIDSKPYLILKPDFLKDAFVTKTAKELDGLFTNLRKIRTIELGEDQASILVKLKATRRLAEQTEPLKSMLGKGWEAFYREDQDSYQLRPKALDNIVNLGLDLQGGMYLDVGVEVDVVVVSVVEKAVEAIEGALLEMEVNYEQIYRNEENQIEILLEPGETLDLENEKIKRITFDYDSLKTASGFVLTLKPEEVIRVKKRAIDQALETIRNRIDQLGVKEPSVQRRGEDSIIVQLPGLQDPDKARRVIGQVAVLNFQLLAENGTPETVTDTQEVLYQEVKDETTKEIINRVPYVLEKKVLLQGDRIRDARVSFGNSGEAHVSMSFDSEGKDIFAEVTANAVGRRMAIVLDNKVQSAPRINEKIEGGEAQITGNFSPEEASELALVLRSGALPAPIVIHEERTVGASLGADSIRQALISLVIGFLVVAVFMIIYYRVAGVFSALALLFNLFIIVAALAYFGATLTLPGMAGIVLTIGMAVDANVLIFERIREEILKGTALRLAIQTGFQKATTTIFDSNITTILAGIILFQFGTGPIKGFAVTLSIGIVASMFTSIFLGKYLFEVVYLSRKKLAKISI